MTTKTVRESQIISPTLFSPPAIWIAEKHSDFFFAQSIVRRCGTQIGIFK